ncbi:peptidyl-prolyl cis-trans isomerase C [Crenobacter luteus]|uniref:peptidylprolyl isomerase n=1 Tax=Crenobacter luteus TaxID=1452487 RepID=A0A163B904_9NEIS|nr:peptidyl-prolyl cis-trans isomerase [Crenobacter luteus]KZE25270.1 hypothetical protein AVW16_02915 [Crenobacter luteus]TCP11593.1 peptidyl-prolyl cis-trans isomerase C [Crenobacter luteus]
MKLSRLASIVAVSALSLPVLAAPVATVNGSAIDKSEVDRAVSQLVKNSGGKMQDTPALREEIKDRLIGRELALQEAKRRGLDKTPQFTERLERVREELLQEALLADIAKQSPVGDAQVKAAYDQFAARLNGNKEMKVRQIVVASEADANKLIADLKKGGSFEAAARAKSIQPGAKQNGGDMGWGNLGLMEPPLAEALKTIGKGQIGDKPLRSGMGYHVFKVEDIRNGKAPAFDDVKAQISRDLQQREIAKVIDGLRAKAKIQ